MSHFHHSVSESDCYIGTNRPEIVHAVGLIGSQVVSGVRAKPQPFPSPISHPGAGMTPARDINLVNTRVMSVPLRRSSSINEWQEHCLSPVALTLDE
jgi:hypothetical protein